MAAIGASNRGLIIDGVPIAGFLIYVTKVAARHAARLVVRRQPARPHGWPGPRGRDVELGTLVAMAVHGWGLDRGIAVIVWTVTAQFPDQPHRDPQQVLDERFARGEIDLDEYRRRRCTPGPPPTEGPPRCLTR